MRETYSALSAKPMIADPSFEHRAVVHPDDGTPIRFRWHWPRGTFDPRMSALELMTFLMPHMPSILPFLSEYPRVHVEFQAMMMRFIFLPISTLDQLMTWVKPVVRCGDDDYIDLCIDDRAPQPVGGTFFVGAM